jgi:hypothetical protein
MEEGMHFRPRLIVKALFLTVFATIILMACGKPGSPAYDLAPQSALPSELQAQPASVQEAYRFAIANPEILKQVPCYCGCGSIGHTSNYQCYVKNGNPDGVVQIDNHALGCSICVDITQDVMRMLDEGKSIPEIKAYVDSTYSKYGPSNMQ